jgi:hypothetical protein
MSKILNQAEYDSLPKILAVDFDGTLAIVEDYRGTGKPNQPVIDRVLKLQAMGWKIVLWTCRDDENEDVELTSAIEMCKNQGLIFDAVNCNISEVQKLMEGDTRKIYADYYADDKACMDLGGFLDEIISKYTRM